MASKRVDENRCTALPRRRTSLCGGCKNHHAAAAAETAAQQLHHIRRRGFRSPSILPYLYFPRLLCPPLSSPLSVGISLPATAADTAVRPSNCITLEAIVALVIRPRTSTSSSSSLAAHMPLEGVTSPRSMAPKTDCWVLTFGHYR